MRQQEVEGGDNDKEEEEMDGVEEHLKKQITRINAKQSSAKLITRMTRKKFFWVH